jgi:chromosome segregation ATPase
MVIRREQGGIFISGTGMLILAGLIVPLIVGLLSVGGAWRELARHTEDLGKVWSTIDKIRQVELVDLSTRVYGTADRLTKLEDRTDQAQRDRERYIGKVDILEKGLSSVQSQIGKIDVINDKLDKQENDRNIAINDLSKSLTGFREEMAKLGTGIAVLAKSQEAASARLEDVLTGRMVLPSPGLGMAPKR